MPRQSLLPKYKNVSWENRPDALRRRPESAALIANCIAAWVQVEAQEGILLGVLLKSGHTDATMAAFAAIHSGKTQLAMISAAGEARLSPQDQELLKAYLVTLRIQEKERNHLSHGIWNVSDQVENGLLWIEAKHLASYGVKGFHAHEEGLPTDRGGFESLNEHAFVYTKIDLERLEKDFIETFWNLVNSFAICAACRTRPQEKKYIASYAISV